MEKVKSDSKNIHSKRTLFFNIGLVLSLLFCFIAFEFKVHIAEDERVDFPIDVTPTIISDKIQPTEQKPKPKPVLPAKKNKAFVITETKAEAVEPSSEKLDIDTSELDNLLEMDAPTVEKVVDPTIYVGVEAGAQFKGGLDAFYQYLSENMVYPNKEKRMGIDGRVILQFIIEVDGSITDIKVLKGVSEGLDNEARRVLAASPSWEPGTIRGQAVRVRMAIPVSFQLR